MDEQYVLTDDDCMWIQLRKEQLLADYARKQGIVPEDVSEFKKFFFITAAVEEFRDMRTE